jgi:hypothetical protein
MTMFLKKLEAKIGLKFLIEEVFTSDRFEGKLISLNNLRMSTLLNRVETRILHAGILFFFLEIIH